ncbi:MAG: hypothetical protein CSA22_10190 [Deltaproteobacteria bacterium]|nr:MAG: hypothetical protein CSA22_10190 [Deltaproteobacteria bacterium]
MNQYGAGEPSYYYDPRTAAYYETRPVVSAAQSWVNFSDSSYLKGFLLGAGVTLVATNPTIQKQVIKGAVKVWSLFQSGVEEVKEQFQDVKAEMTQE